MVLNYNLWNGNTDLIRQRANASGFGHSIDLNSKETRKTKRQSRVDEGSEGKSWYFNLNLRRLSSLER